MVRVRDIAQAPLLPAQKEQLEEGVAVRDLQDISRSVWRYGRDVYRLAKLGFNASEETLADLSFQAADFPGRAPEEVDEAARATLDRLKEIQARGPAVIGTLKNAIDQGAGENFVNIFGTPEQQTAVKEGRPWKRTPDQAVLELARRSPDERVPYIFGGELTDDERANLEAIQKEDVWGPSGKQGGLIYRSLDKLGTGGQATVGGLAGKLHVLQQATDVPPEAVPNPEYWAAQQEARALRSAGQQASPVLETAPAAAGEILRRYNVPAALPVPPNVNLERAARLEETPEFVSDPNARQRLLGIPLESFAKLPESVTPEALLEGEKAGIQQGVKDPRGALRIYLEQLVQKRADQAFAQAARDLSTNPLDLQQTVQPDPAQVDARARQYLQAYLQGDLGEQALRHPIVSEALGQIGLDPLNILGAPIGKGLAAGAKLAGRGLGAGAKAGLSVAFGAPKVEEALQKIRHGFTYMPEAADIAKATGKPPPLVPGKEIAATGKDIGAIMRLGADEAAQIPGEVMRRLGPDLKIVQAVPKNRQEELYAFLTGVRPKEELPQELKAGYEAFDRARQELLNIGGETRALRGWDESGKLIYGEDLKRENWVPRRVLSPHGEEALQAKAAETVNVFEGSLPTRQLRSRASLMRTAPENWFEREPAKQLAAEIEQLMPQAKGAFEARATATRLMDEGWMLKLEPTRKGSTKFVLDGAEYNLAEAQQVLERSTGLKWGTLDANRSSILHGLTGQRGEVKGTAAYLMPESAARYLETLSPLVGDTPTRNLTQRLAETWSSFRDVAVRPYMQSLRVGATLLGGPAYQVNNGIGALGLGGVALGLKALNPKLQKAAVAGAALSAGFGDEAWRATKMALAGGEERSLGELVDIAKRIGLLDQFEERTALALMGKGPVGAGISSAYQKAAETLSPIYFPLGEKLSGKNLGRLTENYQHLVVFLGRLEGTDVKSIAKAADITAQFAGNYRRLSPVEKELLREVFWFYGWNRFFVPHIARQLVENPQRFAPWAKIRLHSQQAREQEIPYGVGAMPEWLSARGMPAALEFQPGKKPRQLYKETNFAAQYFEDPVSIWLGMFSSMVHPDDRPKLLGAPAKLAIESLTGLDSETGKQIPPLPVNVDQLARTFKVLGKMGSRAAAGALVAPLERMSDNLFSIYRILSTPADQLDLAERYAATRKWGVIAKIANAIAGEERALGSAIPGINTAWVKGAQAARTRQKGLMRSMIPARDEEELSSAEKLLIQTGVK